MARIGSTVWVLDESSDLCPLLKVDTASHRATFVRALAPELGDTARECVSVAADADTLVVSLCSESENGLVRLDGRTGATLKTYNVSGSADLALKGGKAYLAGSASEVIELDLSSGTTRVVYKGDGLLGPFGVE